MLFSQLNDIVRGTVLQIPVDRLVQNLIIDSRKAIVREGSIFFAIKGTHHDGHAYIDSLYKNGLRQFIVEYDGFVTTYPEANFLQVSSSIHALQRIAAHHRSKFSIPIIGITGSNGKTIVKEWLYQLLSKQHTVVKNPGSYNSQIGVPLSVWQLQPYHTLGIFEAGISQPGEMENLAQIIKPTIGVFTTLGTSHAENFLSDEQKLEDKIKLFQGVAAVVCCADQTNTFNRIKDANLPIISWGFTASADVRIRKKEDNFLITWKDKNFDVSLPFSDPASVENAFHCMTVLLYMGTDIAIIQYGLNSLRAVPMRLELKEGINQNQLIDDAYNNDLGGLQISLELLANQNQKAKKTLILSDILQSGLDEKQLTAKVAQLVNGSGVTKFIGIGKVLSSHRNAIKTEAHFYDSTEDFLNVFTPDLFEHEVILIKGARVFEFERIVKRLQRKVHGTVMEVDLSALVHNLNYFKSKLKPTTKVMVMVKAFAYGSGSVEVANVLQYHKVDYLGVAYADEGVELRKHNINTSIMVMNPTEEGFHAMLNFTLEPELYSLAILRAFISFLNGRAWTVHIKVDTGMHRLGFEEADIPEVIRILQENPAIRVASVFTHLSGSDEAEFDDFSRSQVNVFEKLAASITAAIGYKPTLHVLNTPGILRFPEFQFDMVRLGIGLYGVDPTVEKHTLRPVNTLKTLISQVRNVKAGETIGYGRRGKAINNMRIGTLAIGYADGYSRAFSRGVGEVLVGGKKVSVIGNVCMDMTMVDLTNTEAREGDEAIIFGPGLSVEEVAAKIDTIPYEILTNTSERVKRIFVTESI